MFKRLLSRVLVLTTAYIYVACGASPQSSINKPLQTVFSWAATARAAGDAWVRAQVPDAYAKQTLEAAAKSLGEENAALGTIAASPQRDALANRIQNLTPLLQQMQQAIEQNDRAAVRAQLATLETEQQGLAALAEQARTQP